MTELGELIPDIVKELKRLQKYDLTGIMETGSTQNVRNLIIKLQRHEKAIKKYKEIAC